MKTVIKFELSDGRIVEAEKDCGCVHHEGPHWLYMNDLDALDMSAKSDVLIADMEKALAAEVFPNTSYIDSLYLRMECLRHQDMRRLDEKIGRMLAGGIIRIIREVEENAE